jgi:hypothetical protein
MQKFRRIEARMSRSISLGRTFLRSAILALPLVLACLAGTPDRALAGGEDKSNTSDYVSTRRHVIDPPVIEPGDDDQPTIVTRKRARQVQLAADSGSDGSGGGGGAAPVGQPRPSIWARWTEPFRAFMGRGGILLRMPSWPRERRGGRRSLVVV